MTLIFYQQLPLIRRHRSLACFSETSICAFADQMSPPDQFSSDGSGASRGRIIVVAVPMAAPFIAEYHNVKYARPVYWPSIIGL